MFFLRRDSVVPDINSHANLTYSKPLIAVTKGNVTECDEFLTAVLIALIQIGDYLACNPHT